MEGHKDTVRFLLQEGVKVNQADNEGRSPLWAASFSGHISTARILLDNGAEVDQRDNNGATPLFVASYEGKLDIVKLLVERGAGIDHRRHAAGQSVLGIALEKGQSETAEFLKKKGAKK